LALDELDLLIQEYDPEQSDWRFRKSVMMQLIARIRPATLRNEPQAAPERSSGHGCKRAGGFVDSGCNALCDCHVTLALSRPHLSCGEDK
jgi:hypothetical protein